MAPIKALLVQYEPQIGKVKENMAAVDSMLEQYTKDDGIDILLLSGECMWESHGKKQCID